MSAGSEKRDRLATIAEGLERLQAENAGLLERLSEGEARFRLIARSVVRVQEAERGRIARELHDGVGQALTALKIQLELLAPALATEPALAARLAEVGELAARALADVRQISRLLRPQMLDDLGLAATLRWLARTFEQGTGIAVELAQDGLDERLDPELETLAYRVAQEALTNVAKHAASPAARLAVRKHDGRLVVEVEDQGAGFDPEAADAKDHGFGLRGMRDRARLFGGHFTLDAAPGRGTRVRIEIPIRGSRRGD